MMRSTDAAASLPDEPSARRATFILRLWHEQVGNGQAEWRGTVEHVQSGERRAVRDATGAAEIVENWLRSVEHAGDSPEALEEI